MEELIQYFGHSFYSKELNKVIQSLGIQYPQKPFKNYKGDILWATGSNVENDLHLTFAGANGEYALYGTPKSLVGSTEEELILFEVTIQSNQIQGVLGLKIGGHQDEVLKKVDIKPKEKSVSEPSSMPGSVRRYNWIFWLPQYKLQVSFKDDLLVDFIRVRAYERVEKLQLQLKALIKAQKKNVNPENVSRVRQEGDMTFLDNWVVSKENKSRINELSALLSSYVAEIIEHTSKKSASKIYAETSKLVKAINKLNQEADFIETAEREDLCAFIERVILATGFQIPDGLDITEEHRCW